MKPGTKIKCVEHLVRAYLKHALRQVRNGVSTVTLENLRKKSFTKTRL